ELKDALEVPSGKNLFVNMIERISKELDLKECWVCGDTKTSEIWPWEGFSLSPLEILKWKQTNIKMREKEQWSLSSKIIGEECITRRG
ncbi:ENR1 protein, partial [Sylvietta virens]|nr:ENR1 protein [Sylvietta virens]